MSDPADLGLRDAAAALAAGELSAGELFDACAARAAVLDELGAFVALAEREAAAPGPLHGIPVGIKDLVDVAGLPTRAGSAATDDDPAAADAPIVASLRAAGAVVLGKTATHELAYGVTTRATINPWAPDRLAGGSSGGSAVAVAVGACPLALGSDTAGSCRIPAALCGVAGMMARPGRLPMDGIVGLAPGLDALGFLARTAADLAFAWTALTGEAVELAGPLRIATAREAALGPADPAAVAAAEQAAARLAERGARLSVADVPAFDDWSRPRGTLIAALALDEHRARGWWPDRAARYGEDVAFQVRGGEGIEPAAVDAARERLGVLTAGLRAGLDDADVIVLPTTPHAAPARDGDESLVRRERRHAAELTRLCGPVNAAGLAAVSVFGGLDAAGLPLGVQLVGRDEPTVLAAAVACEAAIGTAPRPPLLAGAPAGNTSGEDT